MTSSGVIDWVGIGSGSEVVVVGSGSGSGVGVGVGVVVSVATQLAQLEVSTHACWPPEPAHWENVVVDAQILPEEDPTPVDNAGRLVHTGREGRVENVVSSEVDGKELVVGGSELMLGGTSIRSDSVSSDMSVSGRTVAPCIQRGT